MSISFRLVSPGNASSTPEEYILPPGRPASAAIAAGAIKRLKLARKLPWRSDFSVLESLWTSLGRAKWLQPRTATNHCDQPKMIAGLNDALATGDTIAFAVLRA